MSTEDSVRGGKRRLDMKLKAVCHVVKPIELIVADPSAKGGRICDDVLNGISLLKNRIEEGPLPSGSELGDSVGIVL